jgi:alanine racemase
VDKPTTHVAINTDALAHNAAQVLGALREGVRLMAVVKCNAYGHGLVRAARAFVDAGAQWLGVSSVAEGVELREAGISEPTLVFMPAAQEECEALVAADLTATVTQTIHMAWLHDGAVACGRDASAHIYLDTGLGRMPSDDSAPQLLEMAAGLGDVRVTGVYTHYGPPGSGAIGDWMELFRSGVTVKMFRRLAEELRSSEGRDDLLLHCAASALALGQPDSQMDMARVGTLLYGQYPDWVTERPLDLRDAFELRTRVIHVGTVGVGGKIGYGGEFRCRRETRVATLPVGYYHGLSLIPQSLVSRRARAMKHVVARWHAGWGRSWRPMTVRIGEESAPIVGRVAMDHCAVDVTDLPEVLAGDEVVVPVRRVTVNPNIPRITVADEER